MNFEEFLKPARSEEEDQTPNEAAIAEDEEDFPEEESAKEESDATENIEVQKAVVESLAAEKVEQEETIKDLRSECEQLKKKIAEQEAVIANLRNESEPLKRKVAEQEAELAKVGDLLSKNSDSALSNKVALLDRDTEVPDRFPGETREHVLEVIKEARDKAEADGCVRRAQVLEGVLMANVSEGTLAARREALEKLFTENGNIISGPVIEALEKMGISHKKGEDYLLPDEIIKRTY